MTKPKKKRNRKSKTGRKRINRHPPRWRASDATERLWNWFFKPLAHAVELTAEETRADLPTKLEWLFGIHTNLCTAVKTTATVKLPDRRWSSEQLPTSSVGGASLSERLVPLDATLFVRRNLRDSSRVEVQYGDNVFILFENEYEELKHKWKTLV